MEKNDFHFTNLKIHSQYSICEGAVKIDELAEHCKSNKIKSIGLCDSLNLCGALEFAEKISKVGTQPIIGSQINFKVESVDLDKTLFMKGIKFKIISKNLITASYEKSSLNFGEIVNYFNQNNIKIEDIATDDGDLEDVFVQLTKH